jgi:hypothetical protein
MAVVLPLDGASFSDLSTLVERTFGTPLTPMKLLNRADKTARNREFNG